MICKNTTATLNYLAWSEIYILFQSTKSTGPEFGWRKLIKKIAHAQSYKFTSTVIQLATCKLCATCLYSDTPISTISWLTFPHITTETVSWIGHIIFATSLIIASIGHWFIILMMALWPIAFELLRINKPHSRCGLGREYWLSRYANVLLVKCLSVSI